MESSSTHIANAQNTKLKTCNELNAVAEKDYSLKDIDLIEALFYIPSILIFIIGIYSLNLQQFLGELGFTFYFTGLSFGDWIICILLCVPSTAAFEIIRYYARKKNIMF